MQRIPRRQFTDDFKAQAVVLAESVGAPEVFGPYLVTFGPISSARAKKASP
jgi:hypothetical protein